MRPKNPERCASSAASSAAASSPPFAPAGVCAVSLRLTRYWLSVGVHVSANRSEVNSDTVIVTANARKKLPVTPVMEISGRNTTIGVMVDPISGMVNSRRALLIA